MPEEPLSPRLQGLPPVIGPVCRLLVLGSMPGALSLKMQQYYAHPRNHFWRLVYAVFSPVDNERDGTAIAGGTNEYPAISDSYEERLRFALEHGLGLWDVLAACEREGSLDADIRKPEANDFVGLLRVHPTIERIWFNGQAAAQLFRKQVLPDLKAQGLEEALQFGVLPSSSPARTLSFETKLETWRELRVQAQA